MKKQNSKLAFSLIELSVVILIIGILVIGITKGSRIIRASRLKAAQSLTAGSPVNSMEGLMVWYESTLDKSFIASETIDTALGATGTLSTWNDINPQITTPNNATQGNTSQKPRYMLNMINSLPAVNFDGVSDPNGDFFSYDGTRLANTNYTIFVVEQRRDAGSTRIFLGGQFPTDNGNLHLGYRDNVTITFAQYDNDYNATISAFSSPTPRIHSYRFSSTIGKNYNVNGSPAASFTYGGGLYTPTTGLASYNGAQIGKLYVNGLAPVTYYYGEIGEIIEFTRYLTDNERSNVEKYLKQKWGVK